MSKISVRLPPEEAALLWQLQSRWRVDRSSAVRRALRLVSPLPLSQVGWFTTGHLIIKVRLKGNSHEQP